MKLYVADYLGDTHHLGALEHGAYLLLLMAMWRAGGSLPASDVNLAKLARCTPDQWAEIRGVVLPLFKRSRGKITHKRLTTELAKYESTSGKRSVAGKLGAEEKASKNNAARQAIASMTESNCTHNQNQNQSSSEDKSSGADVAVLEFDPDKQTWALGVQLLVQQGRCNDKAARTFIGALLRNHKLLARDLFPAVTGALAAKTGDPQSYLTRAAQQISRRRNEVVPPKRQSFV